ncbi:MAG: hypothetical protein ABWY55_05505 [Microbacterium sp.]
MSEDGQAPRARVSTLRRVIVGVIIVSFGLAAIGGIVVLLGGSLGTAAGRVLGTTAVIGAFSVAVLCCAALAGKRLQVFGLVGAAVSVVAAALVVWVIWVPGFSGPGWDFLFRTMWTAVAASAAFALASLLLLLADRRQAAVRIGLAITIVLFAVVLGMVVYLIWWGDTIRGDSFARVLGVFAILAALGAVVVPVISLLLRERPAETLSARARERLEAEARQRGITADELVDELLGAALPAAAPAPAVAPGDQATAAPAEPDASPRP